MKNEINNIDREEIARLIIAGNTSGRIDNEGDEEEPAYSITWDLEIDKFER